MEAATAYNSIHDGPAIDAAVTRASEGVQIDARIQAKPNRNLLDNWYFGNPVNQRGLTEYTEAGYTIDRWQSGLKVTIANNLITLQALGIYSQIFQTFESQLAGKIVTMSVLIRAHSNHNVGLLLHDYDNQKSYSPNFVAATTANQWLLVSTSFRVADDAPDKLTFIFYPDKTDAGDQTVDILAAKLELGSQQTLAHKDANGNWVLNEIPNYADMLARCQAYAERLNIQMQAGLNQSFQYKVTKRATPAVTFISANGVTGKVSYYTGTAWEDVDAASVFPYPAAGNESLVLSDSPVVDGRVYNFTAFIFADL